MNTKFRKLFTYFGIGAIIFIVLVVLSIVIAGVPTFQIDLIPAFIGGSICFVVLCLVLWMKFGKYEDVADGDTDERYT